MLSRAVMVLDRYLAAIGAPIRWLVLPVSVLLFLQWPLRDLLHAYSQQANDMAQWIFALYVAASVTQATRSGTHLATQGLSHRYAPATQARIRRIGGAVCVLPWAWVILLTGAPTVWRSVAQAESFPETANPGYWIVKLAAWLLALLAVLRAAADLGKSR